MTVLVNLGINIRSTFFIIQPQKAQKLYTDVKYPDDCFIVFGKETAGLPEELLVETRNGASGFR